MPLLHRKLFVPDQPPGGLEPNDEVFHCTLTNEIFSDYEAFYERTILCNSLVWSCSITNRPNLTYQEALDCEKVARKRLLRFPLCLQKPILFLVGLSHRSRIDDLNEDIYSFVRERFFVGEEVEAIFGSKGKRSTCKVLKVLPWQQSSPCNGHVNGESKIKDSSEEEDEDDMPLSSYQKPKPLDAPDIQYVIKKVKGDGSTEIVPMSKLRRRQGTFTRQYSKLFLKANCIKPNDFATETYVVKEKLRNRLGLNLLKWEDIFIGPKPSFSGGSPKVVKTKKLAATMGNDSNKLKDLKEGKKGMEKEEKRKEREEFRKKKAEEVEKIKEAMRVDKERRKKEREDEMVKMKVEREIVRNQKLEEKKRLAEYLKEWSRPRDDLECDDLKELPAPREIACQVPPHLFGDVLSLLQFFHVFDELFEAKDEFPKGVNLDLLTRAVMSSAHDGPLCDLFFFFLSNLFRSHSEEEESFERILVEPGDKALAAQLSDSVTEESLQAFSTLTATWPLAYQGFSLNKLELDSYTLSEVLRIYLLSSATRPRSEDRQWRYQHRGGYSLGDDTPLRLCLDRPDLLRKLSTTSVFDLPPEDKLTLLLCLAHHLLGFVTPRDFLDETWEKLLQVRTAYRDDKMAEKRREKESATEKWKWKCEQLNLEKQVRNKEIEERLKRIEQGLPPEIEEEHRNLRKRKTNEDNDEPRLFTALERKERLALFDDEEQQAKDAWKFRQLKHQEAIAKHYSSYRTAALGQDRYFRRYWVVSTAPGLFVEEFADSDLTDDVLAVRAPQKKPQALGRSGCSTPGWSDSSAAGTPLGNPPPKGLYPNAGSAIPMHVNGVPSPAPLQRVSNPQPSSLPASPRVPACGENDDQSSKDTSPKINGTIMSIAPVTRRMTQGKEHRWFVFTSAEEVENLVSSLNGRGFRESKLLERINAQKDYILESLDQTPKLIDVPKLLSNAESAIPPLPVNSRGESLEQSLKDQILDLEARIWTGTLGFVQVEDRNLWRISIQEGTEYDGKIKVQLPDLVDSDDEKDESKKTICQPYLRFPLAEMATNDDESSDHEAMDTDSTSPNVRHLAIALYIVERGVDRKYIKPPLGCAQDASRLTRSKQTNEDDAEEKSSESAALLLRWEKSLLQCTSVSQIFLHLSTLERCIMWSRSVVNAKCRICRRKGDAEKMLLCDSCDRGHHMYCLKPAVKSVPAGDWFCPDCKPKAARLSPRKVVRTKSFSQDESSDDDEEEEEESEESEEEQEQEEESVSSLDEAPPGRKNLQYKIPQKPQKKGGKGGTTSGSRSKAGSQEPPPKRERTSARKSEEVERSPMSGGNRRRSQGVWKDLAACQEILSDVIKHKDSWPFVDPVNKKLVPDYYDIIKKPMDLGTVLRKMKEVQYTSATDFIVDVDQIFTNCHQYNEARSVVAKAATHLQIYFDSKLHKAGLSQHRAPSQPAKKRRTS